MTTNEMLAQRIYWITNADGLVKIVATQPFDSRGNNSIDWTTTASGLRSSNRMHHSLADERLANHREYRRGTTEEYAAFLQRAQDLKAQQAAPVAPAATERQLDYLVALGVEIPLGKRLTKSEASILIDCAKNGRSGESLGSFGMFYADGSN